MFFVLLFLSFFCALIFLINLFTRRFINFGRFSKSENIYETPLAGPYLVDKLNQADYQLIDCQVTSEHLLSLGAEEIPRVQFIELLQMYTKTFMLNKNWLD